MKASLRFHVSGRDSVVDVKGYPACGVSGHWPFARTGDWARCAACGKSALGWEMRIDPNHGKRLSHAPNWRAY